MEEQICCIAEYIWDVPLIVAIIATGSYLMFAGGFFALRRLPEAFCSLLRGALEGGKGDAKRRALQPYEAFCISLGTTVGFGSITGVALAVTVGGCGAIFWMWVSGLIGMAIKMAEVTLASYYRSDAGGGRYYGSPMDYMEKGIGKGMNFAAWRLPVGLFGAGFAATFIITLQDYELIETVHKASGLDAWLIGLIYVFLTYVCIYRGIEGYRKIACYLVPLFLIAYVGGGLIVIFSNREMLFSGMSAIFQAAFNGHALLGGLAGHGLLQTIGQGMSISVFTNEAGWGTASMLYGRAAAKHPVSLGLLGALEVFVVSMIICTTTALVIVVSGQYSPGIASGELVLRSFATGLGTLAPSFVALMSFLFGLTTVVGWFLYYEVIILYFARKLQKDPAKLLNLLKLIYPLPGMIIVFYSSRMGLSEAMLWNLMAISTGIPALINVFAVLILSNKFFELLRDYKDELHGDADKEPIPLFYEEEESFYGGEVQEKCEKSHIISKIV